MTDKQQIAEYLKDLPSKWADKLTDILYEIKCSRNEPTCEEIRECETLTSLSDFAVNGSEVCITYKDENGVSTERCVDIGQLILLDIDSNCLTDQITWDSLTFNQKVQLIIDSHCDCCD